MSLTTKELLARLERHYLKPGDFPGGVFVPEVGQNGTSSTSRCDAVYVGFTSTSGRRMVGHELKVSRADWRHELDQPGKADLWADGCHEWYVVAPSTEIVPVEELPHGWGLLVVNARTKTRLDVARRAVVRDVDPPWDLVRSVIARNDTLRAQAIASGRLEAERKAQENFSKRLDEMRSAGLPDTYQGRLIKEVVALLNTGAGYEMPNAQDIAEAAMDLARARSAARDLSTHIERMARELEHLVNPLHHVRPALAELLAQHRAAVSA